MQQPEVYEQIEKHYREHRTRLVRRYTGPAGGRANAEDIVQEAYLRALQYWTSWAHSDLPFENWFGAIVRNCSITARSSTVRRAEEEINENLLLSAARDFSIERHTLLEIEALIKAKAANAAYILKLYYLEQYTPQDIVALVGDSYANVKVIIHRFKRELEMRYA